MKEYVALRPYLFGEFYPLTPYSLDAHDWMAWQCDRPDMGRGMLQVFRRPDCTEGAQVYRLYGLSPDTVYTVVNPDENQPKELTGRTLMNEGLAVTVPDRPGAVIVTYGKARV